MILSAPEYLAATTLMNKTFSDAYARATGLFTGNPSLQNGLDNLVPRIETWVVSGSIQVDQHADTWRAQGEQLMSDIADYARQSNVDIVVDAAQAELVDTSKELRAWAGFSGVWIAVGVGLAAALYWYVRR